MLGNGNLNLAGAGRGSPMRKTGDQACPSAGSLGSAAAKRCLPVGDGVNVAPERSVHACCGVRGIKHASLHLLNSIVEATENA